MCHENSYPRIHITLNLGLVHLEPGVKQYRLQIKFITEGLEQKSRTKRPRAPPPEPENDVETDFDERNNPLSTSYVPPGFLSPSVIEYLELGKSIPGE